MNTSRREQLTGRTFLILLMLITLLPFVSMLSAALQPRGTVPSGLAWPTHPHWGNVVEAFTVADMGVLLKSSLLIVLGVVPAAVTIATMAGFGLGHLKVRGGRLAFGLLLLGLTMPFEAVITPIYYQMRDLGLPNTRWALILPLIGLSMPFAVFPDLPTSVRRGADPRRRQRVGTVTGWICVSERRGRCAERHFGFIGPGRAMPREATLTASIGSASVA